MNIKNKLITNN